MVSPAQTRRLARWLLVAAASVCLIGMVGPFGGIEKALVPWDKAAHFMAFYGLTLLVFTAYPDWRRLDLTMLIVLSGIAVEVLQGLDGRDAELGDVVADAAGVMAVYGPVVLEWAGKPRRERRKGRQAAAAIKAEPT